jgi:hypothetical protein
MKTNTQNFQTKKLPHYLRALALVLAPLIIAGIYILGVQIHSQFRYDQAYFSPEYLLKYNTPSTVVRILEVAMQKGDSQLFTELTGLRNSPKLKALPNVEFSALLDGNATDYLHYLYFDPENMHRYTHYVKQVNGRWIAVPQDAYFYFDSGKWVVVIMPIAILWWLGLLTAGLMRLFAKWGSRTRTGLGYEISGPK